MAAHPSPRAISRTSGGIGKKLGFGECEDEQCGRSPAAVGPAEHPVVGFFQNIHAVNVAHRARCGFNGASLPKIFQTGASQRVKSDRNDRVYAFTERSTAGSRRGCLLRRPGRRRRKRRAVPWPGPRPVRGVRRATTAVDSDARVTLRVPAHAPYFDPYGLRVGQPLRIGGAETSRTVNRR